MSKNISTLVVLTFLLVLGLYAGGFYLYRRYNATVTGVSDTANLFGNILSIFKGKS